MKIGREFAAQFDGIFRVWIYPFGAVFIYNPQDVEVSDYIYLIFKHYKIIFYYV